MKTAALAIAVLMSGAAFAQTATTTDTATQDSAYGSTAQGTLDHSTMGHSTTATTVDSSSTMSTSSNTTIQTTSLSPASAAVVQPSNASPERDARGIAVLSDAAMVPDGWNGVSGTAMGGPLVDAATGETLASDSYPACSANVTDNCLQAYERGRSAN